MRIAVLSLATHNLSYAEISNQNSVIYCGRNGYDFISVTSLPGGCHPMWHKIKILRETLPEYDFVLLKDADSVFIPLATPLSAFVDLEFAASRQSPKASLNSGHIWMKNTQRNLDMLDVVMAGPNFGLNIGRHEEEAIENLISAGKIPWFTMLDKNMFNANVFRSGGGRIFSTIIQDTVTVHFQGHLKDDKNWVELMSKIADDANK